MRLQCKNINKSYGSVIALQKAELSVEKGEIRALLGGNGSGKSTIAKILSGVVKEDSGEIYFDDKKYMVRSPVQAKKAKVIMTSQELSLLSNMTVAENLCICDIPTKGLFTDTKKIKEKADNVLELLEIGHLRNEQIEYLSASEQYMIEFAKALVQEPKVLIVDEITSALYSSDVEKVGKVLKHLKSEGVSILFISHRMEEIFAFVIP